MLLNDNDMKQWRLIQYMPDDTIIEKYRKDQALNKFFNSMNATYLEYIKRPISIHSPEQLIEEIGKILISDLSHMEKCFAIGLLIELGGITKNKIRVDTVRKALGISNRGFNAKKALEKKKFFKLKYIPDEKITEVEYLGTNHEGHLPVKPDIQIDEPLPYLKKRRKYNV